MHIDPTVRASIGRSGVLDLAFGAGWSPGMGPILGSILLLAGNPATLGQGILLLLAYALGLGLPFLLAALFVHGLAGHPGAPIAISASSTWAPGHSSC